MIESLRYVIFRTRWGWFGLLGSERGLLRSCLPVANDREAKKQLLAGLGLCKPDTAFFEGLQEQIRAYFEGACVDFGNTPVVLEGLGEFGTAILTACRKIEYGRTMSYGEVARLAGRGAAGRAVGNILAKNPVPLIIPCHRVIRRDGQIGGFTVAGGIKLKEKMLRLESF